MSTTIIAVAGRKQSGKSSLCAFIQAALGSAEHNKNTAGSPIGLGEGPAPRLGFCQSDNGSIHWWDDTGEPSSVDFLEQDYIEYLQLYADSKVYNFADSLKDVCVNILGVKPEQVYGTDEQKNSPTHLLWEKLPAYVRWMNTATREMQQTGRNSFYYAPKAFPNGMTEREWMDMLGMGYIPKNDRTGPMTGREVMQVFGTEVMRKMFDDNVWINATINRIRKEAYPVALVADMRFKPEFHALYNAGAWVIRLERSVSQDHHLSETDFDDFDFRKYERCLIIPADAGLAVKNDMALSWLKNVVKLPL